MTKRFILSINNANKAKHDAIAKHISDNYAFWHWHRNFWLIATSKEDISTDKLRDDIKKIARGVHCIVIEFDGDPNKWSAVGKKDHFTWLHDTWLK